MAPWKRTRQTHADARLSALPSHPAQTRRVLNGHSVRKSRSENIWTVFNGQPFYKSAQLERSGAELLFHPHKVSLCYTNCWRDWDERLEWLNYNKHFLNVWSAFKSRTTHRLKRCFEARESSEASRSSAGAVLLVLSGVGVRLDCCRGTCQ